MFQSFDAFRETGECSYAPMRDKVTQPGSHHKQTPSVEIEQRPLGAFVGFKNGQQNVTKPACGRARSIRVLVDQIARLGRNRTLLLCI